MKSVVCKVKLFNDSPELRMPWCLSNTTQHNSLLGEVKEEFEQLHREALPKPILRARPVRAIKQPQMRRSGRFSYKIG